MTTWCEGIAFGPGVWRDVTPESRTIRRAGAEAPPPEREVVTPAPRTRYGGRRGRPRTPEGQLEPYLRAFLDLCERTNVEGVVLRQTLRDGCSIADNTLNAYASKLRRRGLFPYRIGGTPWRHDMRGQRKAVAR